MMKKRNVFVAAFITLILATGCSAQGETTSSTTSSQMVSTSVAKDKVETTIQETTMEIGSKPDGTESTITGTISDIKDFMFIITDENDIAYALGFDGQAPEGLASVKEGDTVIVTYTGVLEETEAFTGTIISVVKK